jgi:hypothetical protein
LTCGAYRGAGSAVDLISQMELARDAAVELPVNGALTAFSECVMILPKALLLGAQLMIPIAAGDGVPNLNVEPVCKGIAEQGGVTFRDPAVPQEKKNCIESELVVREQLVKEWSSFSAADRTHCIDETTMGGESSYTELLTCLEMARDVRAMRAEEAPSRAGATRGPSSRSTVQPTPTEPASPPTSTYEPPK